MSVIQNYIEFQYNNSMQQAKELEKIAAELKKISDRDMQSAVQTISQNWKGDNATSYLTKTLNTQEKVSKTASSLQKTAASITKIAQNLYDAEMKALAIASERGYGS